MNQTLEEFTRAYWKGLDKRIPFHKRRELVIDAAMLMWNSGERLKLEEVTRRVDKAIPK